MFSCHQNLLRRRDAFLVSLTPPPVSLSITLSISLSMTLSIFPSFSSDDDCSRREETGARGTIISLGEESCVNFSLSLPSQLITCNECLLLIHRHSFDQDVKGHEDKILASLQRTRQTVFVTTRHRLNQPSSVKRRKRQTFSISRRRCQQIKGRRPSLT